MDFKEFINESKLNKNADKIADIFTRFLIGDSKVAVNQLKKFIGVDIGAIINTDNNEYNKQYNELRTKILKAMLSGLT